MIEPSDSRQCAAADALRYLAATRIYRCAVVKLRGF
jgi:hypothetical protein